MNTTHGSSGHLEPEHPQLGCIHFLFTISNKTQRPEPSPTASAVFLVPLNDQAVGGGRRDRTDDLMLAKHALSQLSYAPVSTVYSCAQAPLGLRSHLVASPRQSLVPTTQKQQESPSKGKAFGRPRPRPGQLPESLSGQMSAPAIEATQNKAWWAWVDLNYRPHAYQACALTS